MSLPVLFVVSVSIHDYEPCDGDGDLVRTLEVTARLGDRVIHQFGAPFWKDERGRHTMGPPLGGDELEFRRVMCHVFAFGGNPVPTPGHSASREIQVSVVAAADGVAEDTIGATAVLDAIVEMDPFAGLSFEQRMAKQAMKRIIECADTMFRSLIGEARLVCGIEHRRRIETVDDFLASLP